MTKREQKQPSSTLDEIMRYVGDQREAQGLPRDRIEDETALATLGEIIEQHDERQSSK
jgi:hypothetical protein